MNIMLIRVEMPSYNYGVRVKKVYPKDFEINESLWFELYAFAVNDDWSRVFKSNPQRLELIKTEELTKLLENECVGEDELKFRKDYLKQHILSSIFVERLFIQNRFDRKCVNVDSEGYAYFLSRNRNEFKVLLSDKVRLIGVEVGDLCTITVTAEGDWLVTDVIKEEMGSLACTVESVNDLMGGY